MTDKAGGKAVNDKDLDALLNSALDDFDAANQAKNPAGDVDPSEDTANMEMWREKLAAEAKLFAEKMASGFNESGNEPAGGDLQTFKNMAEAAALAIKEIDENAALPDEPHLAESLTEALKQLKEGSNLLEEQFQTDNLSGMFSNMGLDDENGDNPFLPMMQGMMQSLLSAEVLLPSLKELLEKYPSWLDENKDKISAEDKERYAKQQDLFKIICTELEKETPNDSSEVKNERFKIVLKNMQKLNEYGQPPADLVGDPTQAGGIPQFDPSAFSDPSQCSVM